ncbi:MAG: hypothetical protein M3Z25_20785, partial [Actinomycetota bacterium]|nr:hypothetical protein [Actinomycetota bacterium]
GLVGPAQAFRRPVRLSLQAGTKLLALALQGGPHFLQLDALGLGGLGQSHRRLDLLFESRQAFALDSGCVGRLLGEGFDPLRELLVGPAQAFRGLIQRRQIRLGPDRCRLKAHLQFEPPWDPRTLVGLVSSGAGWSSLAIMHHGGHW